MEEIRQAALAALAAGVPAQRRMLVRICLVSAGRVLVARRSDDEKWLPGQWQLPCGAVEQGEAPIDAAIRETREEVGIVLSPEQLLVCGTGSFQLHRPERGVVEDWGNLNLLAAVPFGTEPAIGPELSAATWLSPAQALARVPEEADTQAIGQALALAVRACALAELAGLAR